MAADLGEREQREHVLRVAGRVRRVAQEAARDVQRVRAARRHHGRHALGQRVVRLPRQRARPAALPDRAAFTDNSTCTFMHYNSISHIGARRSALCAIVQTNIMLIYTVHVKQNNISLLCDIVINQPILQIFFFCYYTERTWIHWSISW